MWKNKSDVKFIFTLPHTPHSHLNAAVHFSFASASAILRQAFSIFGMLLAKEKRMQLGSPNASPITEETCAVFNKYMQRSLEF